MSVPVPEQQNDPNWLQANQYVIVEFYYVYVDPGTYRSVAKADSHGHVAELNEQNNLALRNIDVSGDMADLRITGMKIVNLEQEGPRSTQAVNCNAAAVSTNGTQEPQLTQGVRYGICITIQNAGSRDAGDFVLSWNPDALGLIVPNVATLTTQVAGLSVFESRTIPFEFTYEQDGAFRSIAEVDAFKTIQESNEDNNKDILNVVVAVAPIDLSITSFSINPSSPTRGSKATATITVRNNSDYPTKAFSVQWKLTGEDGSGPSTRIQGLLPFQSETVELEGTFFIAGDYTSVAIVDVFDEIPETNENNNTATRAVTAQKRVTQVRVTFNRLEVKTAFEDGVDEQRANGST